MPKKNLINQTFGKLTVLEDSGKRASNGSIIWHCRCECGNEIDVAGPNLTRKTNSTTSCGCKNKEKIKDLTNQKFNSLLVLEATDNRINGKVVWKCQCDCGNIHYVTGANLQSGAVKSCGKCYDNLTLKNQYPKRQVITETDIIGHIFSCQKVLEDSGQREKSYKLYLCECIHCHTQSLKNITQLKALKGNYCYNCQSKDIANQQFGYLTAIKEVRKNNNLKSEKSLWECLCKCGKIVIVQKSNLISGNTMSCGCMNMSKGAFVIKKYLDDKFIDYEMEKTFDTCIFPNTKAKAKFDFYLPKFNMIIEYDGEQHFHDVSIFSESLEEIQKRDSFKNKWCEENNYILIRIPYTDFNNIDKILANKIKEAIVEVA